MNLYERGSYIRETFRTAPHSSGEIDYQCPVQLVRTGHETSSVCSTSSKMESSLVRWHLKKDNSAIVNKDSNRGNTMKKLTGIAVFFLYLIGNAIPYPYVQSWQSKNRSKSMQIKLNSWRVCCKSSSEEE